MEIGEIIRRCRKQKNLTQEEMANRLGVTAPAVNKWENGGSLPDITMLAPIARLLDITVDTLLSFRDNLTPEEINGIVRELDVMFEQKPYREVFAWAKKKLEEYPSCEQLIWQVALILDARRMCGNALSDEAQEAKATFTYNTSAKTALMLADGNFEIYAADGACLVSVPAKSGEYICLEAINPGVVILKSGKYTLKAIVK